MLKITEQWIYPTEDDDRNCVICRQSNKTLKQLMNDIINDDRLYNLTIRQNTDVTTITYNIFEGWCPKVIMVVTNQKESDDSNWLAAENDLIETEEDLLNTEVNTVWDN